MVRKHVVMTTQHEKENIHNWVEAVYYPFIVCAYDTDRHMNKMHLKARIVRQHWGNICNVGRICCLEETATQDFTPLIKWY